MCLPRAKMVPLMVLLHMADGSAVYISHSNVEYVGVPVRGQCAPGTKALIHMESGRDLCLTEDPETVIRLLERH